MYHVGINVPGKEYCFGAYTGHQSETMELKTFELAASLTDPSSRLVPMLRTLTVLIFAALAQTGLPTYHLCDLLGF